MSSSKKIVLGIGLGVLAGLFVGEHARALQTVVDIYVRLMQITVVPYLAGTLVLSFGQLNTATVRRLAPHAGVLLVVTWCLTAAALAAVAWSLPAVQSASFFSETLIEPPQTFSVSELYFSSNPFHALANAVVPAIVLFSSMLGLALIGVPDRERVLGGLRVIVDAITRITTFVVRLTPLGVFAIATVAAGTLTLESFERVAAYLIVFAAASLLLGLVLLPLSVTAVTPFRYREVAGIAQDALLTAFVAGNAFIVLPILVERSKLLIAQHGLTSEEAENVPDLFIPILFNFPNAGRLLTLLFVPFAAWLANEPFSIAGYATLFAAGIPTYFGKAQVALPYLLDLFALPHDLLQLYIPTTILTGRLDSAVTAMSLLVFALLGAASMGGFLRIDRRRIVRAAALGATATLLAVGTTRVVLSAVIDTTYHKADAVRRMHAPRRDYPTRVHADRASAAPASLPSGMTSLERVRARGTLRVGYDPDNLPYSFVNGEGELVGFDIDLVNELAESLGVTTELLPVGWHEVAAVLERGEIDVMPSVWYRPYWFESLCLSDPYMTGTMGLLVRDERRNELATIDQLRQSHGLRIGVPIDRSQVELSIKRYFGDADVTLVPLPSARAFLAGELPDLDGFMMPAESGSAATLLHPELSVVVPQPDPVRIPFAFGTAARCDDLVEALNEWTTYAHASGTIQRAYDYWIRGKGADDNEPRWSILRNVLGWKEGP